MKEAVIAFYVGPFAITSIVVTTWGIMLLLGVFCWLATRRLALDPGPLQTMLEGVVSAIEETIAAVLPDRAQQLLPFIGTLWIYIVFANLNSHMGNHGRQETLNNGNHCRPSDAAWYEERRSRSKLSR